MTARCGSPAFEHVLCELEATPTNLENRRDRAQPEQVIALPDAINAGE
jgi:hypothetical protein